MTILPWRLGAPVRAGAPARLAREAVLTTRQARQADAIIRQREAAAARELRRDLAHRFVEACADAGFGSPVQPPAPHMMVPYRGHLPRVHDVELTGGPNGNPRLLVELRPGQTVGGLQDAGEELAAALGAFKLHFIPYAEYGMRQIVEVQVVEADPLASTIPFLPATPPGYPLVFGVDEFGSTVSTSVHELVHMCVAGPTRGGKSAFLYALLAQLRAQPHVLIAGLDPTGLVLEPWGEHPWRAIGTEDAADRYLRVVEGLVVELDRRITALRKIRPRTDKIPMGPEYPTVVVVIEEAAAVAKLCGHKGDKPSVVHRGLSRILAEGAKARIFVVISVQRAEATVIGSFERDQCLVRLTFPTHDKNTMTMLHPEIPEDIAATHGASPKGTFLLTAPGIPLGRCRAPWIGGADSDGGYAEYCRLVEAFGAPA
jgi:hypothetical protein